MVRRTTSFPPEDRILSPSEMRSGIERLQLRIQELKALDPQSISDYRSPEIVALEASIQDAFATTFGHGTPKFKRYRLATDLEPAPVLSITPDWVAVRGGSSGPSTRDIQELQQGITERKNRAVALLEQAVRSLTEELTSAERSLKDAAPPAHHDAPAKNAIFVVHGHYEAALQAVARFLEQLGLEAIVLREQPDSGRTIIEKFEDYANQVGFAVVLLTPDDIAGSADAPGSALRARQNVIFELGYFAGKLGRGRACLLRKGSVEIPSDLYGVIYKDFDQGDGWKLQLVKELKAAKLAFDANRAWGSS